MSYRTTPTDTDRMPPGVPWIIGNEAAERFSFYGMRTILVVFMVQYLHFMDGAGHKAMEEPVALDHFHTFASYVYFTPLLGAFLSDIFLGKYRTILWLSLVYCLGHAALACMGMHGNSGIWLASGLGLICLGAGGIKPCVSSNVGDQFGPANQPLLTRVYNWFYFSINLGSFVSTLLTPWLLEWYGPHLAFGVPGVLMAIATLLFWMGRHKFVHVPPGGGNFFSELGSREGLIALAKLIPLFFFFVPFWSLYDQTGSSWIIQAQKMNLHFLGIDWLGSQIQAVNPILVLGFIPLFTFIIYPAVGKVIRLTPLRKIGVGLFLISSSYALTMLVQSWIDAGRSPSIGWQFLSYILITAAEILVSVVGLEFAYTQAPRKLKSVIMSLFLFSSFAGNQFTAALNRFIQIPSAAKQQLEVELPKLESGWQQSTCKVTLPGYDGKPGTADDFVQTLEKGEPTKLELPGQQAFDNAARIIEDYARQHKGELPDIDINRKGLGSDLWGNPIRYEILASNKARIISDGPDRTPDTMWDLGVIIEVKAASALKASDASLLHPAEPWLLRRQKELGLQDEPSPELKFERASFSGGQTKLHGAAYFRFFMWLMLGTAIIFVPFAMLYRPRTYLQHQEDQTSCDRFSDC